MLDSLKTFLANKIQKKIIKWAGIDKINAELDTIRFILNNGGGINICEFPPTTGLLRKCQLYQTELLRIVHDVCEKNGLKYWLDFGTLLGSYRHKVFVPWDDDIDIAMEQNDYDRAMDIINSELLIPMESIVNMQHRINGIGIKLMSREPLLILT